MLGCKLDSLSALRLNNYIPDCHAIIMNVVHNSEGAIIIELIVIKTKCLSLFKIIQTTAINEQKYDKKAPIQYQDQVKAPSGPQYAID